MQKRADTRGVGDVWARGGSTKGTRFKAGHPLGVVFSSRVYDRECGEMRTDESVNRSSFLG